MVIFTYLIAILVILIGLPTLWLLLTARGSHGNKFVYLTFDDGPDPKVTPHILALLKKYKVKATFFVMGKKVKKYPNLIKAIVKDGHELGNHSFSHPTNLGVYLPWKIWDEYLRCEREINKITNKKPTFARFPQGTAAIYGLFVLKQLGYKPINWSVEAKDWEKKVGKNLIERRIISKARPGSVILLHDGLDSDIGTQMKVAEALPKILETFKKKNFQFSTL